MATTPLRPRAIPQCSACLRSYAFSSPSASSQAPAAFGYGAQQIRGKKKMVNNGNTVPVRLLKDVKTFGRRGTIIPIAIGRMRNDFFPRRIAEYVTLPERKQLRLNNTPIERNFAFGTADAISSASANTTTASGSSTAEMVEASMFQKKPIDLNRLTPERSAELVERFTPQPMEFYRQPIIVEAAEVQEAPPPPEQPAPQESKRHFRGMGAAADLMAARSPLPAGQLGVATPTPTGPQAIYGSVSTHDVLMFVRAAMETNDEAARVGLREEDVRFVDLPEGMEEGADAGRVKFVGDYTVEIGVRGAEKAVPTRRTVRVIAQEVA